MSAIRGIMKKELIEQLRDKRTLWLTILIPLLLNSGMLLVMDWYMGDMSKKEAPKIAVVGTWSSEEKAELEKRLQTKVTTSDHPAEEVKKGDLVAYIEKSSTGKTYLLHTPGGGESSTLLTELELFAYKQSVKEAKLSLPNQWTVKQTPVEGPSNPFLFYFPAIMLAIAPFIGGQSAAIDAIAGEKERRTIQSLLTLPISRRSIWIGKWLAVSTMVILSTIVSLGSVTVVQKFLSHPMFDPNALLSVSPITLLAGFILIVLYCCVIAAILLIVSTFAKSFKEAQSYVSPVMIASIFMIIFLLGKATEDLAMSYFAVPVLSIHAMMLSTFQGAFDLTNLLIAVGSNLVALVILIFVGVSLFCKPQLTSAN